jgi:hypothetical protein
MRVVGLNCERFPIAVNVRVASLGDPDIIFIFHLAAYRRVASYNVNKMTTVVRILQSVHRRPY